MFLALIQNEIFLGAVIIALVFGIAIHKWFGLGRFIRLFTGSGSRLKATKRAATEAAEAAEVAKIAAANAEAEEAEKAAAKTAEAAKA